MRRNMLYHCGISAFSILASLSGFVRRYCFCPYRGWSVSALLMQIRGGYYESLLRKAAKAH